MRAKKILIVEDDKMLSTIYKMFLNELGHELVGIYSNAADAIAKCKSEKPDVILMDIQIKGEIDGIDASYIIQDQFQIPVIFVTSITDDKTIARAAKTKSYGFLIKPIDKVKLGILIELAVSRHNQDKEVKIKDDRYHKLIEDSPNAVMLITNNIIQFVNFSGLKLFGTINIEKMIDCSITDFLSEENPKEFLEILRQATISSDKIKLDNVKFKTIHSDNFLSQVIGSTIEYKGEKTIQLIVRDSTRTLNAERKLKESEEKIKMLSLTSNDAYWDWELETNNVFFSPKFKAMLGYEENELENTIQEWEKRLEANDKARILAIVKEHIEGKTPFYSIDYQLLHKDGSFRWFNENGIAIKDEYGKAQRLIGTFTDNTEWKKDQNTIQAFNANLKAIFESNKEAIVFADKDYKVIDFNKKASEYYKKIKGKKLEVSQDLFLLVNMLPNNEAKELFHNTLTAGISHNLERAFDTERGTEYFEITIYPVIEGDKFSANRFCLSFFDITNLKNIEYDLIETRAELKPLFESSIQRFYLSDLSHKLVAFNRAAQETIKDEFNRIIKKGDNVFDFIPLEIGIENLNEKFDAAKKGEHIVLKNSVMNKSCEKWIETHVEPISNEKGEIIRVLIWTLDITKEKMSETALIESQKKYYSLFTEANDAILMINDDHNMLVDCNDKAVSIFGYSKEELLNMNINLLSPPTQNTGKSSIEMNSKLISKSNSDTKKQTFEWSYVRKNGEEFDAEVSLSVVKIGKTNFRYAIIRDVTERNKTQLQLEISEQKNKSLIEAIPDLIFVIDKDGNYRDFHADNQKIYKVSNDKIVGKNLTDFFAGQSLEDFRNAANLAIKTQKLQTIEYQLESSIGWRWFEARLTALNNNAVFCLVRDLNEKKGK
jgi:PAS domain S-box-containing protein